MVERAAQLGLRADDGRAALRFCEPARGLVVTAPLFSRVAHHLDRVVEIVATVQPALRQQIAKRSLEPQRPLLTDARLLFERAHAPFLGRQCRVLRLQLMPAAVQRDGVVDACQRVARALQQRLRGRRTRRHRRAHARCVRQCGAPLGECRRGGAQGVELGAAALGARLLAQQRGVQRVERREALGQKTDLARVHPEATREPGQTFVRELRATACMQLILHPVSQEVGTIATTRAFDAVVEQRKDLVEGFTG